MWTWKYRVVVSAVVLYTAPTFRVPISDLDWSVYYTEPGVVRRDLFCFIPSTICRTELYNAHNYLTQQKKKD